MNNYNKKRRIEPSSFPPPGLITRITAHLVMSPIHQQCCRSFSSDSRTKTLSLLHLHRSYCGLRWFNVC